MTEIESFLFFLLVLYILNNIKIKKTLYKNPEKIHINAKIKKYGQIQYNVINNDNNNLNYKYQNINYNKLSNDINQLNKYNDLTKLNNTFDSSQNNFQKNTITNLPCQQDIIYDTKFYQPSDADIYNPTDLTTINYKERKIEDVYNNIVNNKKQNKKKIHNINEFQLGASGLKTYRNIDWEYEDDNDDGLAYDPRTSNLSVF